MKYSSHFDKKVNRSLRGYVHQAFLISVENLVETDQLEGVVLLSVKVEQVETITTGSNFRLTNPT